MFEVARCSHRAHCHLDLLQALDFAHAGDFSEVLEEAVEVTDVGGLDDEVDDRA